MRRVDCRREGGGRKRRAASQGPFSRPHAAAAWRRDCPGRWLCGRAGRAMAALAGGTVARAPFRPLAEFRPAAATFRDFHAPCSRRFRPRERRYRSSVRRAGATRSALIATACRRRAGGASRAGSSNAAGRSSTAGTMGHRLSEYCWGATPSRPSANPSFALDRGAVSTAGTRCPEDLGAISVQDFWCLGRSSQATTSDNRLTSKNCLRIPTSEQPTNAIRKSVYESFVR